MITGRPESPDLAVGRPGGILARMFTQTTFWFTYGTGPSGCHGRRA